MEFVKKWPNWLRWTFVLASAIIAFVVSAVLIMLLNNICQEAPQFLINIFCQVVVGWAAPFAYVWVGCRMAPKNNGITAVVLSTIFIVCSILLLFFSLYYLQYSKYLVFSISGTIWYTIRLILGIIGMVFACQDAYKYEESINPKPMLCPECHQLNMYSKDYVAFDNNDNKFKFWTCKNCGHELMQNMDID